MCYDISLTKPKEIVESTYKANMALSEYSPIYHISAFSRKKLYCIPEDAPHKIYKMYWGLLPYLQVKKILKMRKDTACLNIPAENLMTDLGEELMGTLKRCLILADGFFEPHHANGKNIPYYCFLRNKHLFSIAGIYNRDSLGNLSCSLITKAANPFFEYLHNRKKRMPLVLDPHFENKWIRKNLSFRGFKEVAKEGFINEHFRAHPVSRDLYKAGIDTNNPKFLKKSGSGSTLFG